MPVNELSARDLYRRCDPRELDFTTTDALDEIDESIGQPRAVAALEFGVEIEHEGYNLFALGPEGIGKRTLVQRFLERRAKQKPTPPDWCYVNNFDEPHRPKALSLPAGKGKRLREDMERFTEDLGTSLPAAFESDEYRTRKQVIDEQFNKKPEAAFAELHEHAHAKGFAVLRTPVGVVFAPTRDKEVIPPEEIAKLPDADKQRLQEQSDELEAEFQQLAQKIPEWERERRERLRDLNREVTSRAVAQLIGELRRRYDDHPAVVAYLDAVEHHVIEHAAEIIKPQSSSIDGLDIPVPEQMTGSRTLERYQVNVLVDNSELEAAPVVFEDNPTYHNLIGRVEHLSQLGTLLTDFRLIRAGALHRANGGYLVLDARKLLVQPYAWEGIKRALRTNQVKIESLGQVLSLITTVALDPESIPLDVKIVLLGDRRLYYLLAALDPEFPELFKVEVDFDDQVERTPETNHRYARLIATIARRHELRPLDCGGVARVLEHSSRWAGDAERLTTHVASLVDLLHESDHCARKADKQVIDAGDVQAAIDARIFRSDRVRARLQEQVLRDTVLVDTEGTHVGQVNGLSVLSLGDFAFGHATRITAQVRLGRGKLIDIEREVELGGPIHSKGVLILSSFLGSRYVTDRPLALSASLVFEQSYGGVEGDSASCAELFALLSAIATVPLRQSLAVTGSMNQHGKVQAIGGVNEKIEGFFDLCAARGLTGRQGVLIPAANVKHLMLRSDVIEAVEGGRFHVYPITTVDEGIELLTGMTAGQRDDFGNYPRGSINLMVETRLEELAEALAAFASKRDDGAREDE